MNIICSRSVGAQLRYMLCILFGDLEQESVKAQLEIVCFFVCVPKSGPAHVQRSADLLMSTSRHSHLQQ